MIKGVTTRLQREVSQLQKDMVKMESKFEGVNEQIQVNIQKGLKAGMLKV